MSDPFRDKPFPKAALYAAAGLCIMALGLAVLGEYAGVGRVSTPESAVVESRMLNFSDGADGAVVVTGTDGSTVAVLSAGTNGFMRGVMRAMSRGRKQRAVGGEAPYRLTLWADGRLTLEDPQTGYDIALEVFGPDNSGAFATLLETYKSTKTAGADAEPGDDI